MANRTHHTRPAAFNRPVGYSDTPKSHTGRIRSFYHNRILRYAPTFLDIIEQIAENVALCFNSDHK